MTIKWVLITMIILLTITTLAEQKPSITIETKAPTKVMKEVGK